MAQQFDVVIAGGGSAGIGLAASLLKRDRQLNIAIIEPSEFHYYQPSWTLIGGGVFAPERAKVTTASVMPKGVAWIQSSVSAFQPQQNTVTISNGDTIGYQHLVVATGLELNWGAIDGLEATLGRHGVTSNYRYDLAQYTWELVSGLKQGRAVFTQPAMPIKCAGAPQKAVYLSCDHWQRQGRLQNIEVEFYNVGAVVFGVPTFVPPLTGYMKRYGVKLGFKSALVKVDGPSQTAWFDVTDDAGNVERIERRFDMLHVVPPQRAPKVVRESELADAAGWCEVNQTTLQHVRFANVFSLGDVCSAPNAKTMAAARKQVVVVAENLLALRRQQPMPTLYDGYGACPLTVERGRVVLAEFGYGGKLLPTFPLDPAVPRRFGWFLKVTLMPLVYWHLMLKGREWLARPSQPE